MKLVLIDGYSMLFRAFYGMPSNLTDSEGHPTGAVYGFLTMLFPMLKEEEPDALIVALDSNAPTFRHEKFADYKGTRKATPEELKSQFPLIREVLDAMGICMCEKPGWEGDDILGTLSRRAEEKGYDVTIVSGDRDNLQLATDKVKIYMPRTKGGHTVTELYYAEDVKAAYGVTPQEFIDVKALQGDTADNIPGVPGIGEKTAQAIIQQYHSVENAHEHAAEVKPPRAAKNLVDYYDQALLSKDLATIRTDAPIEVEEEKAVLGNIFTEEALELYKKLGFRRLLHYFSDTKAENNVKQEVSPDFPAPEKAEGLSAAREVLSYFRESAAKETVGLTLVSDAKGTYGFALSDGKRAVYLPVFFDFSAETAAEALSDLFASGGKYASDDLKRDFHFTLPQADPVGAEDVTILAYLIDPLPKEYPFDALAQTYLHMSLPSFEEIWGNTRGLKEPFADTEKAMKLACSRAETNRRLLPVLLKVVEEQGMSDLYRNIERPLCFTLFSMEKQGIYADPAVLKEYGAKLDTEIARLEKTIYEAAGEEFNINSPKQLGVILFEKLGLPGGKKTKTGYSTAADVLEKLSAEAPIVKDILDYRQYTKLKSTYAEGLLSCIAEDGRIHTTYQQTVTATGRLSSTDPNLQNIPIRMALGKEIRRAFLPEEGWTFTDADYSQIELRVLAHMSGDENLINAYKSDADIHRATAALVFHKDPKDVTDLDRRRAKAVNFGIVYGISSFGLGENLHISRSEAEQYIENYYLAYPKLKEYLDRLVADAKKAGYALTMFGRRRPIPELAQKNYMQRQFGERVAMNSPIQGTAADIMKKAMVGIFRALRERGLKSRLLLQVHDEVLIETAPGEEEAVREVLIDEMEHAVELSVPLEIDIETGTNWYDAK